MALPDDETMSGFSEADVQHLARERQERSIDQSCVNRRFRPGGSGALRIFFPLRVTIDIRECLLRRLLRGNDRRGDLNFRIG